MEKRLTLEEEEIKSIIEYLKLLSDNSRILDREYVNDSNKNYGYILEFIKNLKESLNE